MQNQTKTPLPGGVVFIQETVRNKSRRIGNTTVMARAGEIEQVCTRHPSNVNVSKLVNSEHV